MLSSDSWVTSLVTTTFGNDGQLSRKIAHVCLIGTAVILLQIAFQRYIFHCPDHGYRKFSLIFFFAPAFPLFLIGWLSNVDFQNGIRGVCYRCWSRTERHLTFTRIRWWALCGTMLTSHLNAYVAPFFWFVMCLLNKRIMTCYTYGPPSLNHTEAVKRHYLFLETYSQLVGFDLLLITLAVVAIFTTVKQVCKKSNPGKKIPEFEVLDNYASYEANAARDHLEEIMKQTAKENGRKKVQMLLEAKQPNLDQFDGVERDLEAMSYNHLVDVRNSLMDIYPKLYNAYDAKLQYYTIDEWKKEKKIFREELLGSPDSGNEKYALNPTIDTKTRNGEKIHLLEFEDKQRGSYNAAGV